MSFFSSILIANRGEIAVRIIRACRALGIEAVAVYSDADAHALHVREADRAFHIGPAAATESYLNIEAVLAAARSAQVEAIHPGYGFLSENAQFAQACAEAGLVFIGPPVAAIDIMGSKSASKALAIEVGVPTVPGYNGDNQDPQQLQQAAEDVGYPLLIKASAGGGGKGMRVVSEPAAFQAALEAAQREAQAAFGDARVLLERLIEQPRHIEIQVLGDQHGNIVHLGERECSIQRRHQKIVEEAPSPVLDSATRAAMGAAAIRLAQAVNYTNAGTVEFILDQNGHWYFLEMNTRLQVEHPVTEAVTGIDLAQMQIAIAAGERLPWQQADITQRGHAIEVRIYAEDPILMLPSTGTLSRYEPPLGPGVRLDTGVTVGDPITTYYDPMIAKLIVSGAERSEAIARLQYALATFAIEGVSHNIPLLKAIIDHPAFLAGATSTDFLVTHAIVEQLKQPAHVPIEAVWARALLDHVPAPTTALPHDPWTLAWRPARAPYTARYDTPAGEQVVRLSLVDHDRWELASAAAHAAWVVLRRIDDRIWIRVDQTIHHANLVDQGVVWNGTFYAIMPVVASANALLESTTANAESELQAPMPGTLIKLLVASGEQVTEGQPLLILEAMKMEHTITAPRAGTVVDIPFSVGDQVSGGSQLIDLDYT